jgi:hypothetical protein
MSAEAHRHREPLRAALESGQGISAVFRRGRLQSLVEAWKHDGHYVVTWEEARDGDQYNEHAYTRDHLENFASPEDVFAFFEEHGIDLSLFEQSN